MGVWEVVNSSLPPQLETNFGLGFAPRAATNPRDPQERKNERKWRNKKKTRFFCRGPVCTDSPRTHTCIFELPGLRKHHQKSTGERKRTKWEREGEKKSDILGGPAEGRFRLRGVQWKGGLRQGGSCGGNKKQIKKLKKISNKEKHKMKK